MTSSDARDRNRVAGEKRKESREGPDRVADQPVQRSDRRIIDLSRQVSHGG